MEQARAGSGAGLSYHRVDTIKGGWAYILASKRNGTLYIGVTSDLARRVSEHQLGIADGFTRKHGIKKLVWCEAFNDIRDAIACERRMKAWRRQWKLELIESVNPDWRDLSGDL